jgi:hypothetical protein
MKHLFVSSAVCSSLAFTEVAGGVLGAVLLLVFSSVWSVLAVFLVSC